MVDYVADANELVRRVRKFAFTSAPDQIADKLQSLPGVQADVICSAAELLYAHRDILNEEGTALVGELFNYAVNQGWSGFNQGDRSQRIVAGVARDLNEGTVQAADTPPEQDPEPQTNLREEAVDWRFPDGKPEPEAPDAMNPSSGPHPAPVG